jgi:hypothetical protein
VWGPGSPLPGPLAATRLWRAKTRRRKDLSSAAHVGDRQAVGIGAGRPAQLCVTASVGDTLALLAPLRLCAFAREKQRRHDHPPRSKSRSPPHPDRSRRAAEPQSAHLKRDRRRHPRALGAFAPLREKNNAATTTPPLEEPIAATPGQVAQSRRAAERSPQARSSATPQTSLRLCAFAREKQRRHDHPPARRADRRHTRTGRAEPPSRRALTSCAIVGDTLDLSAALRLCARQTTPPRPPPRSKSRSPHPDRSRRAASRQELCRLAPLRDLQPRRAPAIEAPPPDQRPRIPHPQLFSPPLLRPIAA